jgi:hypothetical protein
VESNKVKLPKDVAEAIGWYEDSAKMRYQVMVVGFNDYYYCTPQARIMQAYTKEHPDLFAQAVLNGYEVEQTPEDEIRVYYQRFSKGTHSYDEGYCAGVIDTLKILNIKIKGVND